MSDIQALITVLCSFLAGILVGSLLTVWGNRKSTAEYMIKRIVVQGDSVIDPGDNIGAIEELRVIGGKVKVGKVDVPDLWHCHKSKEKGSGKASLGTSKEAKGERRADLLP